jgi:hypothetical protein
LWEAAQKIVAVTGKKRKKASADEGKSAAVSP